MVFKHNKPMERPEIFTTRIPMHAKTHVCLACRLDPECCGHKPDNRYSCKHGQIPLRLGR